MHPAQQLRAALLWAANPLLLQVLVAGAHVDGQAVVFGVAAVAVMSARPGGSRGGGEPPGSGGLGGGPPASRAAMAGVLVGLGFAVKVTIALVGLGLAIALILGCGIRGGSCGRRLVAARWRRSARGSR